MTCNFGKPLLSYHNFAFKLSVLYFGVENKIFKEILHSHNMTYMTTPQHKTVCLGVVKLTILLSYQINNFCSPSSTDPKYQIWVRLAL